jgi:hypothetical protein
VLMTCVGIGFSNLSKTLKWHCDKIRPHYLQTKQKLPRTPKRYIYIQDRIPTYILRTFLIFHQQYQYRNKRRLLTMWFPAIPPVTVTLTLTLTFLRLGPVEPTWRKSTLRTWFRC